MLPLTFIMSHKPFADLFNKKSSDDNAKQLAKLEYDKQMNSLKQLKDTEDSKNEVDFQIGGFFHKFRSTDNNLRFGIKNKIKSTPAFYSNDRRFQFVFNKDIDDIFNKDNENNKSFFKCKYVHKIAQQYPKLDDAIISYHESPGLCLLNIDILP
jgi:uncharacterized protein YPO0396